MQGQPQQKESGELAKICALVVGAVVLFGLLKLAGDWWNSLGEWTRFFGTGAFFSGAGICVAIGYAMWSCSRPLESDRNVVPVEMEVGLVKTVLWILIPAFVICLCLSCCANNAEQRMAHGTFQFWREMLK